MAYPALISLRQTINGFLLNSSRINSVLKLAYDHVTSLKQLLIDSRSGRSSQRLSELDGKIRDCAHELEDVLEFHEFYSSHHDDDDDDDDVKVRNAIASFSDVVRKLELEYIQELSKHNDDDDDAASVPSYPHFGVEEMFGNSSEFKIIRTTMLVGLIPHELCFFLVHGEVRSGRKIVAKAIYEDLAKEYDCCAWVTIGTEEYRWEEVLEQILAQVDNSINQVWGSSRDRYLWPRERCLWQVLEHRRYVIVLDDVRKVELVEYLKSSLPNSSNGSRVFYTSSLLELKSRSDYFCSFQVPDLHFEEMMLASLLLLMFDDEAVPPEFIEAGKKIVQNCRGLRLLAAKTMLFLHKTPIAVEEWRKIAADKQHPVFILDDDEISERSTINAMLQSYCSCNPILRYCATCKFILPFLNFNANVERMKKWMKPERFFCKMQIISLLGMAGIGKSCLARKILEDQSIVIHYDHRVWVTLGPKYQSGDVLIDILAQTYPNIDENQMKEDAELTHNLCVQLSSKRCLIVLDDLWSKAPLCHLKNVFPDIMGLDNN